MATESTPQQNNPDEDNRTEYSVPPVVVSTGAPSSVFDEDGFELPDETVETVMPHG